MGAKEKWLLATLVAAVYVGMVDSASAHGGGLAADGCHNDRKAGTRHCHRKNSDAPAPAAEPRETSGDCSQMRYNRREWSYRGHRFRTSTGYYSNLQCSKIDADHVVSLKDAHQSGGCRWSRGQKSRFANDADNLVPSCAHVNRSKGARLPASFIRGASDGRGVDFNFPSANRCSYLALYRRVKEKYGLSFGNNNMGVLSSCTLN